MAEEKNEVSRREALKGLGLGVGIIASLPVLGSNAAAQHHKQHKTPAKAAAAAPASALKFFTEAENRTVIELTERIIPFDDNSPGAKEAKVSDYIDSVLSIANEQKKKDWRDGLAAINKMSRDKFSKEFADATEAQQIELLTAISKNEKDPKTVEERFFKIVKEATIDGYYTSEIGIHKELKYRGNSYINEFKGCQDTHLKTS